MGVLSPTLRLNSRAMRSGSVTDRTSAASPYIVEPSSRKSTTEGTAAVCVPSVRISARPSRHAAAAVKVVPRSTPRTHATATNLRERQYSAPLMADSTSTPTPREAATALLDVCVQAANVYQRDDLGGRLSHARERLVDPLFHVLVVGEFKQGKSSLINALLGVDVCPVDDDIATAVPTLLRWSDEPTATVHLQPPEDAPPGTDPTAETLAIDDVRGYITEA